MTRVRLDRIETGRLRDFGIMCLTRQVGLAPADIEAVHAGLAEMRNVSAGVELIAEGARLDTPQLLLEGWAVRQRLLKDGRRQILSFVLPGDVFGLCGLPDGIALCSIVALTPVTAAPMPMMNEALLRDQMTALGRLGRGLLVREEVFLCNQVVRLGRQLADERLISLLLELHARLQAVGLTQDRSFSLPLTQEMLSDALGLSVVHTNRTIQQLRREQLIATRGTLITLSDLTRLTALSDYRLPPHRL